MNPPPSAESGAACGPAVAPGPLGRQRIVLCQTSHPGNIGSAARAMKTMGLARLYLVRPQKFPHPDATALASGASDLLDNAVVCDTLSEALAGTVLSIGMTARRRDLSHEMLGLREAAGRAIDIALAGEVAWVFGTEMFGLSNEELDLCGLAAHIPTNPGYSSLNLAQAVQVAAYELAMTADTWSVPRGVERELASHDQIEGFYAHLEQSMIDSRFLNPDRPKRLMTRLRRLFARTALEKEEVNILRGILTARDRLADDGQS